MMTLVASLLPAQSPTTALPGWVTDVILSGLAVTFAVFIFRAGKWVEKVNAAVTLRRPDQPPTAGLDERSSLPEHIPMILRLRT